MLWFLRKYYNRGLMEGIRIGQQHTISVLPTLPVSIVPTPYRPPQHPGDLLRQYCRTHTPRKTRLMPIPDVFPWLPDTSPINARQAPRIAAYDLTEPTTAPMPASVRIHHMKRRLFKP